MRMSIVNPERPTSIIGLAVRKSRLESKWWHTTDSSRVINRVLHRVNQERILISYGACFKGTDSVNKLTTKKEPTSWNRARGTSSSTRSATYNNITEFRLLLNVHVNTSEVTNVGLFVKYSENIPGYTALLVSHNG
jgi:hypothetical protein